MKILHHLLQCHAIGINSSVLHFSNLICQTKSLMRIIASSSSKLLSRVILRSVLRILFPLQINTTLTESASE